MNNSYFKNLEHNLGRTVRKIRKNKNLTQKRIAGDFMEQSTVGRIENSTMLPSYLHFIGLAYNLNITANELIFYTAGNNLTYKDRIVILVDRFNASSETAILEEIRELCIEYFDETRDNFFSLLLDCVDVCRRSRSGIGFFEPEEEIQDKQLLRIWKYLMDINEWHVIEWEMISLIIISLPPKLAIISGEEILSQLKKFQYLTHEMLNIRQQIVSCMAHVYLRIKQTKEAQVYFETLMQEQRELTVFRLGNAYIGLAVCHLNRNAVADFNKIFYKGLVVLLLGGHTEYLEVRKQLLLQNYPDYAQTINNQFNKAIEYIESNELIEGELEKSNV